MRGGGDDDNKYNLIKDNIMLLTDSYKLSHYAQYPVVYTLNDTTDANVLPTIKINKDIPQNQKYGAYNVSYFEARGSNMNLSSESESLKWAETCFFGLQYFIKKHLKGDVINRDRTINTMNLFVDNHISRDMFPSNDWKAILKGSSAYGPRYGGEKFEQLCDPKLTPEEAKENNMKYSVKPGHLPIRIDAIPEGSIVPTSVPLFKITNTHPRFYWLPNYLETLLVQMWYPMTICTSTYLQRLIINHYTTNMTVDKTALGKGLKDDMVDLVDFGFRGVSSLETAQIGSMSYLAAGFIGSDTPVGVPTIMKYYTPNDGDVLSETFIGSSIPASEHSTITSWCKYDGDSEEFENRERKAWMNQLKQYGLGKASNGLLDFHSISFVIDGYNTWNAIKNQFLHEDFLYEMEKFFAIRLDIPPFMRLIILRPDSGEATTVLPQMAQMLKTELNNKDLTQYPNLEKIKFAMNNTNERGKFPLQTKDGEYVIGFTILQGDSVDPQRLPSYCAAIDNAGFDVASFRFGSGGGLLQKVNRDTFKCAFKCSAMIYPNINTLESDLNYVSVVKNPITSLDVTEMTELKTGGEKLSKAGWVEVDGNYKYFNRLEQGKEKQASLLKCVFKNGIENITFSIGDIRQSFITNKSKLITDLDAFLNTLKETTTADITQPTKLASLGAQWFSDAAKVKRENIFREITTLGDASLPSIGGSSHKKHRYHKRVKSRKGRKVMTKKRRHKKLRRRSKRRNSKK